MRPGMRDYLTSSWMFRQTAEQTQNLRHSLFSSQFVRFRQSDHNHIAPTHSNKTMQTVISSYESINNLGCSARMLEPSSLHVPEQFRLRDRDICCGRGKGCWNHPGNQMFQTIIHASVQRYSDAKTKNDKSLVVASIVEGLTNSGARFVKLDKQTGRWYDIGRTQARDKTGHAIRDLIMNRTKREAKKSVQKHLNRKVKNQNLRHKEDLVPTIQLSEKLTPNSCSSYDAQQKEQPFGALSVRPIPLTSKLSCGLHQRLNVHDIVDLLVSEAGKGIRERKTVSSDDLSAQEVLEVYELLSEEESDAEEEEEDQMDILFDDESSAATDPFLDDWL